VLPNHGFAELFVFNGLTSFSFRDLSCTDQARHLQTTTRFTLDKFNAGALRGELPDTFISRYRALGREAGSHQDLGFGAICHHNKDFSEREVISQSSTYRTSGHWL
jgi:hypothetical protein